MIACTWKYPIDIQYHEIVDPLKVVSNDLSQKLNFLVPDLKGILVNFEESSIKLMNKDGHYFDSNNSKVLIVDVHPELSFLRLHALVSVHVYRMKVNSLMTVVVENKFPKNYYCRSQNYKRVFVKINKLDGNLAEADDGVEPIILEKGMKIEVKLKSVNIDAMRVKVTGVFVSLEEPIKEQKKSIKLDVDEDIINPEVPKVEKKKKKHKSTKIDEDYNSVSEAYPTSDETSKNTDNDFVKRKRKKKRDVKNKYCEAPNLPNKRIKMDPDELPKKSDVDNIWTDED